jgi:DNA-binding transcriptional regulator/RsmH inhibitor MraZ
MMGSRARIDERGRLHIPTTERERASIPLDSEVLVVPKGPGHIELILVGEARLEQFQKNMRGRLKHWKEQEHRADKALAELASRCFPIRIGY